MAPVPKKENIKFHSISKNEESTQLTGDEVVISGISGTYPNSENVLQFMENLYGKKEMINYDSSGQQHPEFPKRFGKLKNWQQFDAQFFRVTHTQAVSLNPLNRVLLENSFNAMFDAGINPITLSGSRVGVYIGSSPTDTNSNVYKGKDSNNFIISGFSQTMLANRISYWLNARGPSYAVDLADASSALCLELACKAIRTGDCDAAIVGACTCCINPFPSISMKRLGYLSLDGKTKCFTETGDGNVRSEGVGVLFLQKARDAKRIYGEICHVKGKYFPDPDGTFLHTRNPNQIEEFLQEFYSEIKISADDVDFIEANAIGFAKSDRQELEAISNLFGRRKPIKVGTVKSNVGHVESNSAICAIIKICLAYQKGLMPGNLYDNEPQNLIKTENDGRVQILTDHTPIKQGAYIAINNFSFTGGNYHILLKDHHKSKAFRNEKFSVPYLILVSGRQEKSVNKILDHLGNNPIDVEEIALLRNIFQHDIPAYTSRGYIILGTNILNRHLNHYPGDKRPVWFLYSGMGSQWQKMGLDLLKIPIFAQSIEKCQKVLIPLGINLLQILSDPDESIFDNILNCFVGIAAVQIGLTDILNEIGIVPDNLIGHSVGELGCAYADGCLTAEEMILCAYYRGLVSIKTNFIKGSMAAVGLGYKAILKLCPPGIAVACHNSDHSSTISGPADKVKQFVAKLTNLGIFAKEVPTANIAYHSEYIREAGPGLLKYMKSVIIDPKLRSEKWLCTSAPRDKWNTAKYASAEYFTNNLLSPVYFEETALLILKNALVIEIAPHGLLQAIVKRSHPECHHIPLTRRDTNDSIVFLLSAIGKMYEAGLNPKMESMYPKVNFPVSTDTPSLSHLVEWEHSEKWDTYTYSNAQKIVLANRAVMVLLYDNEYKYIEDHVINGVTILPAAAILVFVWETLAMYNNADYRNVSVIIQNVQIYCEVKVETEELLKLNVEIQKGFQYFEVTYDDMLIAKGKVRLVVKTAPYQLTREDYDYESWTEGHNLYKILNARGYSYKGEFQSIRRINFEKSQACIEWNNNWVAFLDGLIQSNMSFRDHNGISNINFINELVINPKNHKHVKTVNVDDKTCYIAEINRDLYGITKCGGVKMEYITFIDYEKPVSDFILSNKRSRNLKVSNKNLIISADTLSIPTAFPFFRLLIDHSISSKVISDADSSESVTDSVVVPASGILSYISLKYSLHRANTSCGLARTSPALDFILSILEADEQPRDFLTSLQKNTTPLSSHCHHCKLNKLLSNYTTLLSFHRKAILLLSMHLIRLADANSKYNGVCVPRLGIQCLWNESNAGFYIRASNYQLFYKHIIYYWAEENAIFNDELNKFLELNFAESSISRNPQKFSRKLCNMTRVLQSCIKVVLDSQCLEENSSKPFFGLVIARTRTEKVYNFLRPGGLPGVVVIQSGKCLAVGCSVASYDRPPDFRKNVLHIFPSQNKLCGVTIVVLFTLFFAFELCVFINQDFYNGFVLRFIGFKRGNLSDFIKSTFRPLFSSRHRGRQRYIHTYIHNFTPVPSPSFIYLSPVNENYKNVKRDNISKKDKKRNMDKKDKKKKNTIYCSRATSKRRQNNPQPGGRAFARLDGYHPWSKVRRHNNLELCSSISDQIPLFSRYTKTEKLLYIMSHTLKKINNKRVRSLKFFIEINSTIVTMVSLFIHLSSLFGVEIIRLFLPYSSILAYKLPQIILRHTTNHPSLFQKKTTFIAVKNAKDLISNYICILLIHALILQEKTQTGGADCDYKNNNNNINFNSDQGPYFVSVLVTRLDSVHRITKDIKFIFILLLKLKLHSKRSKLITKNSIPLPNAPFKLFPKFTLLSISAVQTAHLMESGYHRLWTLATAKLLQMRCCSLNGNWNLVTNAGTQLKIVMATYFRPGVVAIQLGKCPTTWL
ncbi:hypothetical protein K1T71_008136 [Dendrolimus kikuchii]|uniref:Uncharacterized protein n=1 Tax=Dendrolimus kikuchii TaxID=765133 RepID=A0ACC1CXF5_9NEOP|nr:hypothetical protein K1T71_008136 [Dendrolimus kikuchii]